jgi:hypothetical protein
MKFKYKRYNVELLSQISKKKTKIKISNQFILPDPDGGYLLICKKQKPKNQQQH